ncbi:unnamed protein product [Larinioides sclopetarius]|uniref:Bax inhibitor 1 n=1 Tax=Larinioides sclopetarius TaxID=280406 RepID=A0AAV2AAC9_9ARAC
MDVNSFFRTMSIKMEPPLQHHMKNVYSCVALSTLSAAVGAFVHVATGILSGGLLSALGSLGLMITLMNTPDDGKNTKLRLGYLLGFAFLSGLGLGPLLDVVIAVDPAIIPTAFFSTCLVFTCFTLASMFSNQRQYIYLGGTLMSLLSVMTISAFLNIFMGSYILFKAHIYLGLLVMCAFILYDTQIIMEKRRNGDRDYIWHSVGLFLDLIQIFRYLLVILTDKEKKESNKKKK